MEENLKYKFFSVIRFCASSIMRLTKLFKSQIQKLALNLIFCGYLLTITFLYTDYFFFLVWSTMIDNFTHKCNYWMMTTGRGYYVHDFWASFFTRKCLYLILMRFNKILVYFLFIFSWFLNEKCLVGKMIYFLIQKINFLRFRV